MKFRFERLYKGSFEFPITLSLFGVFKLFCLLLLKCELTVVHILVLEMYRILLHCFFLEDGNSITINFTYF